MFACAGWIDECAFALRVRAHAARVCRLVDASPRASLLLRRSLLSSNCRFLQCGVSGLTPLHLASAVLDVELVQLLLLHGARPDLQLYSSRATAMHVASQMILWTHVHQLALNIVSQARALHSATGTLLDVDSPQFAKLGVKFQLSPLQNLLQLIASDPDEPTGSGIANADSGIPLHTSLRTVVQHLLRPPFSTLVTREVQDALRFRARRIVRMMVISGQQLDPPVDVDKRDYAGHVSTL